MVLTSTSNETDFEEIASALIEQHGMIHVMEGAKRDKDLDFTDSRGDRRFGGRARSNTRQSKNWKEKKVRFRERSFSRGRRQFRRRGKT